jgi:hypothetical protein
MREARLPELPAMLKAYDPGRKIHAYIPVSEFSGGAPERGEEVRVKCGNESAIATVKKQMVLVEVDIGSAESAPDPGQEAMRL